MNLSRMCDRIISIGYLLLFILVPLILTPINYELFEFNKMIATYVLTITIVSAWLIKQCAQGSITIKRSPADIPILLFLISQFVSTLTSIDPHVSWYGYYSRFNGGFLSLLSYALLYWVYVQTYIPDSPLSIHPSSKKQSTPIVFHEPVIIGTVLCTGVLVALYGVLEHLGIDKNLWVQDVQSRVFSSLGQPNWLAAYLVVLIPLSFAKSLTRQSVQEFFTSRSVIWGSFAALFFLTLLYTRSRSGLLAFAVADTLFWLYVLVNHPFPSRKPLAFLFHCILAIILVLEGSHIDVIDKYITLTSWTQRVQHTKTTVAPESAPAKQTGTLLEYGGTESGTIRKYVWQAAIDAWKSSPKTLLIGTGTESFAFTFYQFRPKGHNLTSEWDFLYNKAHNEYLNYLATTGLFGLGSYLMMLASFAFIGIRALIAVQSQSRDTRASLLLLALLTAWTSILITNFFGFSIVIMQLFLFILPAIAYTISRTQLPNSNRHILALGDRSRRLYGSATLIMALIFLIRTGLYWHADTLYAAAYRANRTGDDPSIAPVLLKQALVEFPGEPLYHDELSLSFATLASSELSKNATQASDLLKNSIAQSDLALRISPNNVNFWKTRTKILYSFSSVDPAFNAAAIETLTKALALSPNDPKIMYNLAVLYGREGDNQKAIDLLQTSIAIKANYRDSFNALYIFYKEMNKPDDAKRVMQQYVDTVDPNDKEFLDRIR